MTAERILGDREWRTADTRCNWRLWRCYELISPTCDQWQCRFLSAMFYASRIIRLYTLNYIPPLCLPFSPFPSDSWSVLVSWHTNPRPPNCPISRSQTHQTGCRTGGVWGSLGAEGRLQFFTCASCFCPRLHYEHGRVRLTSTQAESLGKLCVFFFLICSPFWMVLSH